jgi:hypothetical protein
MELRQDPVVWQEKKKVLLSARKEEQLVPAIPPFNPMPIGIDMAMKLSSTPVRGHCSFVKPGEVLLAGFFWQVIAKPTDPTLQKLELVRTRPGIQ